MSHQLVTRTPRSWLHAARRRRVAASRAADATLVAVAADSRVRLRLGAG